MPDKDIYKTIRAEAGGLYREKGSRFISLALPVSSENEIRSLINGIRKDKTFLARKSVLYPPSITINTGMFISPIK